MTTPSSPNPLKFSDINTELGKTSTSVLALSNTSLRTLFGQTSGVVNMGAGRGKNRNVIATGGTTYISGGYKYHKFTSTDYLQITALPLSLIHI